jgi:primosomal protein N' (replication factor Y)
MLVPEIALTEQTIERFRSRFEGKIAVLHHRLNEGERFDEWHRIANNEVQIVIGARSAIFAPLANLGLIIVDEEHEGAYKQSEGFSYHARDVAVMRGHFCSACVILGSATPSLESMYNVSRKKYTLLSLTQRAEHAQLPAIHIVDMKREAEKAKQGTLFSELLIDKLKKRLALGEQSILFLNRRGYHTTLSCNHCKTVYTCPSCALALTFHRKEQLLSCHLCDYHLSPLPTKCALCNHHETLKYSGVGTEKLESAVHALFPEARVLRIDSDTTRHKVSIERLFTQFRTHKADILIGTQMVAKGLHFPSVTLVALINADGGLNIPDFRSSERIFQLITQVSGRAGRGALPGEVIIQSYLPNHETIQAACKQDFDLFYKQEIAIRELFDYPPFSHLVKLTFTGKNPTLTEEKAVQFRQHLISCLPKSALAYPLVPCGYAKIKDHFRFQFLIKGPTTPPICLAINQTKRHNGLPKEVKLMVDVDPISTFF